MRGKVLIGLLFEELAQCTKDVTNGILEDQQAFNKIEEEIFDILQREISLYFKRG